MDSRRQICRRGAAVEGSAARALLAQDVGILETVQESPWVLSGLDHLQDRLGIGAETSFRLRVGLLCRDRRSAWGDAGSTLQKEHPC